MDEKPGGREAQRLETRERVFEAAIAEFKRKGTAEADITAIVTVAGVARGTFYFHFPTREHVLIELERREEVRMATELSRALAEPHELEFAFAEVTRRVVQLESRLGRMLFSELLAVNFSPTRPEEWPDIDEPTGHPVMSMLIDEVDHAQNRGTVHSETDPTQSVSFFILGLYALLITSYKYTNSVRENLLDNFLATVFRGLEPR